MRKGDKGEEVRTLQRLLGVTVSGDFSAKTEAAVKSFQNGNSLTADGIVGAKTWAALMTVAENATVVDPSVIYDPLKSCITKVPGREIRYLVIHYTAGTTSAPGTARKMKAYWEKTRAASADFAVDDRDMVQFNPDPRNYKCWAVSGGNGVTNANSVSIEICSSLEKGASVKHPNHEGWYFTDAALDNAARLAKIVMKRYGIPIERVVRHYDVTGKICPGVQGWTPTRLYDTKGNKTNKIGNENEWLNFKKRLV